MEKVISYVNTNRGNGRKENLKRMYELLERLDNPQDDLSYVHITGTNGKGSTAALLQAVLKEAGLDVGLFTSPHIEVVNERLRFNGENIADADFIRLIDQIEPVILELEAELNEKFFAFELLTAVAFMYFKEKQPDIVLLEAGIGGRLDSTNVIQTAAVSIITSIGLDHTLTLGDTEEEVMQEKVGILKEKGHLIVGPIRESLKEIAVRQAEKTSGTLTFLNDTNISIIKSNEKGQVFDYKEWENVKLSLLGKHQIENACLVLEACLELRVQGYSIPTEAIYKGLAEAYWPGRFEKAFDEPLYYMDGAHNVASVERLVETLEEIFPERKFHFVIGMMEDKEYEKMIQLVAPLAQEFIFISPDPSRGFDAENVAAIYRAQGFLATAKANIKEVLTYVEEIPKDELVIQFGSLYLVGEMKEILE